MIKQIKIRLNSTPVKRSSMRDPEGLTSVLPFTGITGFVGPCGCGKTHILSTISHAVFAGLDWREVDDGFQTEDVRVDGGPDTISILSDSTMPDGSELYFIRNPEQIVRPGRLIGQPGLMTLIEETKDPPEYYVHPCGPVHDLLHEVLIQGVGHEYLKLTRIPDRDEAVELPSGLMPFWLIWYMLRHNILQGCDVLVLDDAAAGMYPTLTVLYAKLLVLLFKQYGIQIIYSSNNSDFVEAIQSYVIHFGSMYEHCTNYILSKDQLGVHVRRMLKNAEIGEIFDGFNEHYDVLARDTEGKNEKKWNWAIRMEGDPT